MTEWREILAWAGFLLTLLLLFLRGGYHVGVKDEHVSDLDEWRRDISKKVAEINGLSVWRATADRERASLGERIEKHHEKHNAEEAKIRDDLTHYIDRVEGRLAERIAAEAAACHSRIGRVESAHATSSRRDR